MPRARLPLQPPKDPEPLRHQKAFGPERLPPGRELGRVVRADLAAEPVQRAVAFAVSLGKFLIQIAKGPRLDRHGLEIHRGVWWRSRIRVPRSRVQHTDVHQGPLDRRWGLADLTVFTAGTEAAAIRLPGLPAERALALRDALLQGHDKQL